MTQYNSEIEEWRKLHSVQLEAKCTPAAALKYVMIWSLIGSLFGFLLIGLANGGEPHPTVMVQVAAAAQLAAENEAPILPDDFASNDPPQVSANWIQPSVDVESAPSGVRRWTREELEAWTVANCDLNVAPNPGMQRNSEVWQHLVSTHGFKPEQVNGLDQRLALKLHDSAHNGKISPWNGPVLYTADSSWHCPACVTQQRILETTPPDFAYATVRVPSEGKSPTGGVPAWMAPNGARLSGAAKPQTLSGWISKNTPESVSAMVSAANKPVTEELTMVEVDSRSPAAVMAALAAHLSSETQVSGRSWLPEIEVDVSDPILKTLESLMSRPGFELGGLKVSWPEGKRSIAFDPPVDVTFRKIVEVSSRVKSLELSGREVTIRLDGRLINDLKVILK